MEIISGQELKHKLMGLSFEQKYSFVESFIIKDDVMFCVFMDSRAIVFYLKHGIRKTVQYIAESLEDLGNLLDQLQNDELIFKCSKKISLGEGWQFLGQYKKLELDLKNWKIPAGFNSEFGVVTENPGNRFDEYLIGPDRRLLRTLADCLIIEGQTEHGKGMCAYRIIDTDIREYYGMYMANLGLGFRAFFCIIHQALNSAKLMGAVKANTVVNMSNEAAMRTHQLIGYQLSGDHYFVWSNFNE